MIIKDINKIFEIWKDSVGSTRVPDPTSLDHQVILRDILIELNWNDEVINELIYSLRGISTPLIKPDPPIVFESRGVQDKSHEGDAVKFINNPDKIYTLVSNKFYEDLESALKRKSSAKKIISDDTQPQPSGFIFELENDTEHIVIVRYAKTASSKIMPSKIGLKYEKSSESFNLGPRYIVKGKLDKKISPTELKSSIKSGIMDRTDLDQGLKDYLIDLTDGTKFGTKSIKIKLSNYIPQPAPSALTQVGKNFGELLGMLTVANNGDKILIPSRSNEPLLDFTIYKKDGSVEKYSSKAKGTSKPNTIKTTSLVKTIESDFPNFKKGNFKKVYKWMKLIGDFVSKRKYKLVYFPLFKEFGISYDKKMEKQWTDWNTQSDDTKKELVPYWNERKLKLLKKLNNSAFLTPLNELVNGLITVDFVITTVFKSTGHVTIEVKEGRTIEVSVRDKNSPASATSPRGWEAMGLDPK